MNEGLETTFQLLAKTDNEAAVGTLIAALDSSRPLVQERALSALLTRRSAAGGREILRRLHTISQRWKKIIRRNHGRITHTLRDAVLGTDRSMCRNACRAAIWFREYDLIPTLLNVLEDQNQQNADLAVRTLLELTEKIYDELAAPRDYRDRRDPQLVRRHVIGSLESSVKRFGRHQRREVIEAFLLLVKRDNAGLKHILCDPHHAAFLAMIDVLTHSPRRGVIRLVLSFLDDPHVARTALAVVSKREDARFVEYLLRKIGREPSGTVAGNLKRIKSIAWLRLDEGFLDQLDDAAAHAAVRLVMTSGIPRLEAFSTIRYLLKHGAGAGRREAAAALAEFPGAEANALAMESLHDPDPEVQANVILQLRARGIPRVLPRLVEMVDNPHPLVRKAVRESLEEFSFERYVGAFDMLDEDVRRSTGLLVKKIDPKTLPLLKEEMLSKVRSRRLRGLAIARTIETVNQLEETIVALLDDEDHLVRVEAAGALAYCSSESSRRVLAEVLNDRSELVRRAAAQSLDERNNFTQWRETLVDPRD